MRPALLALALVACNGTMESYFAQDVVEMIFDQSYIEGSDNPRQKLDLYLPRGVDHFPVVVFIHGGYWIHQDKNYYQPIVGLYRNVGIALARKGVGAAVINYRLVPDVTFAEQLDDVVRSIAWVHAHIAEHRGRPDALVIAGHSAGGHIAALAAFDDRRLAGAGVDPAAIRGYALLSPILDLEMMAASPPRSNAEIAAQVFGADLDTYSPRIYFKRAVAPLLVMLGDRDEPFLLDQVPPAVAELQTLGAPVAFHVLAGTTHDDVVLRFDTDEDAVTPSLVEFVLEVTR